MSFGSMTVIYIYIYKKEGFVPNRELSLHYKGQSSVLFMEIITVYCEKTP